MPILSEKGAVGGALVAISWVTQTVAAKHVGVRRSHLVAAGNQKLPARIGPTSMMDLADWMEEAAAHLTAAAHRLRRVARQTPPLSGRGPKRGGAGA
jgi:hypothetical protein